MDLIAYLPAIVAFAAALVAIVGAPKWDPTQTGRRRLTQAGQVVLALAALALLASSILTWRAQSAADTQRINRERVTLIAHTELRRALRQLSGPFDDALWETGRSFSLGEFGIVPAGILDPQSRKALASLNLHAESPFTPAEGPPLAWGAALAENARAAAGQIDRVLQTYAAYLDADILVLISDLQTSEFFQLRLLGLDDFQK